MSISKPDRLEDLAMHQPLSRELTYHEYIREQIRNEFPDIDEETLADTLEGLTNLNEMLGAVIRSHLDDMAMVDALKSRVGDMQDRLSRISKRADKKRELVTSVMEQADRKKLAEADFTVSLRSSSSPLMVTEEGSIPEPFWKPQAHKLDRQGLIAALKSGAQVSGAVLGNPRMTIAMSSRWERTTAPSISFRLVSPSRVSARVSSSMSGNSFLICSRR